MVEDFATVTQHQVDKARGTLGELVGKQIILHPSADGTERYLTAELSGDYAGLIRLVLGRKINLVEGRGFEPPSLAASALKLTSTALAEGASPLARSPRRGHTPFETPRSGVQLVEGTQTNRPLPAPFALLSV